MTDENWNAQVPECEKIRNCEEDNGGCIECDNVPINEQCEHLCIDTPLGYRCACRKNYKLAPDNRGCSDINECEVSDPCDQVCELSP